MDCNLLCLGKSAGAFFVQMKINLCKNLHGNLTRHIFDLSKTRKH